MHTLSCADMGHTECSFVAKGESQEEVMKMYKEHAKAEHGMMDDDMSMDQMMMDNMKMM